MSYNTRHVYTGNGVTTDYAIPFAYDSASEIKVARLDNWASLPFTVVNPSLLRLSTASPNGIQFAVYRETDVTSSVVSWSVGTSVRSTSLNSMTQQFLRSIQELKDVATDSITMLGYKLQAAASATAAAASAAAALVSQNAATTSATNAATSLTNLKNIYYGPYVNDPTTRPDSTARVVGDMYYDSINTAMKVWNGSAWVVITQGYLYTPVNKAGDTMTGILNVPQVYSINSWGGLYSWKATSASADQKNWDVASGLSDISFRAVNDAYNAANVAWKVNRGAGYTVSSFESIAPFIANSGVTCATQTVSSVTDLSKHLNLYSGNFGMSITAGQLNYNVPLGAGHVWYVNGSPMGFVDANGWTFTSGNSVKFTGLNAGLELGNLGTANTPYIDFHSYGDAKDYDVRLIASGGTSTLGQGYLTLLGLGVTLQSNAYVNFGSTYNAAGYGLRDNSGVIEVKSNGGVWAAVGAREFRTAVSLSGLTSYDLTNIPPWARMIIISAFYWKLSGSAHPMVQLGNSANGIQNTGYVSNSTWIQGGAASGGSTFTTGFHAHSGATNNIFTGQTILTAVDPGYSWIASHNGILENGPYTVNGGGRKSLVGGPIDRIRITTTNGTDTFNTNSFVTVMITG